jgi:hypothetical protein
MLFVSRSAFSAPKGRVNIAQPAGLGKSAIFNCDLKGRVNRSTLVMHALHAALQAAIKLCTPTQPCGLGYIHSARWAERARRLTACLLLCIAATAEETAPGAPGYAFVENQARFYQYVLSQKVSWDSAGEKLDFQTEMRWHLALRAISVNDSNAVLNATIISVQARHIGPGSDHSVDSAFEEQDDALLGHLSSLAGVTLVVSVDPRTGHVSNVNGGDEIVKRINQRSPAAFAGDPPPLDAALKAAYSNEALKQWWGQFLALPQKKIEQVPLHSPLQGTIERQWTGNDYILVLPANEIGMTAQLLADPTPVAVTVTALSGKGRAQTDRGYPGASQGAMDFTLAVQALTQGVEQKHHLEWTLSPIAQE